MFETKRVLNEAWAELSPAQRNERWRQNEDEELRQEEEGGRGGGGWESFKLDEATIRTKAGKSGKDKDKTDSTTTNKQETARSTRHAGRRISCFMRFQ